MNKTAPDQYEKVVTDTLKICSAKLRKNFITVFIQTMILYMILPRKIPFLQMGRYSDSSEQRFRQLFECKFDWMDSNFRLCGNALVQVQRKLLPSMRSTFQSPAKNSLY